MGEVATETSEAHTTAAKNNIQGKARSRKVRRFARAITSNIEGGKPRSRTTGAGNCKKEEKTSTVQGGRYLPASCGCLPISQIELRFVYVDISIPAINATHLLGIYACNG
jgi:hypothetical protein